MVEITSGTEDQPFEGINLLPEATVLLRDEARSLEFVRIESGNFGIKPSEARITSPFNMATTEAVGYCRELARSPCLRDVATRLLGREVALSACNYLLYDEGSFIGLHTDRPGCEVNALFLIAGPPSAVELRPFKSGETVRDLLVLSRRGHGLVEDETTLIPLAEVGNGVMFRATRIPHQRRPAVTPVLLLSICYGPRANG